MFRRMSDALDVLRHETQNTQRLLEAIPDTQADQSVCEGHRDLKRLLNERAVPGFVRGRLPLLFRGAELLAVANLPGLDGQESDGWKLHWQPTDEEQGLA